MIITIDGQAATKKSPTAYILAQKLGFKHISSGLVYRATAVDVLKAREEGTEPTGSQFNNITSKLRFGDGSIQWLGSTIERHDKKGVKVFTEEELTNPKVTECASYISLSNSVRDGVEGVLKRAVEEYDVVVDGRDMGTALFPRADLKFFFEARFESRSKWRHEYEGEKHGESLDAVMIALKGRDAESFWIAPATDAITINVEGRTVRELADYLIEKHILPYRMSKLGQPLVD